MGISISISGVLKQEAKPVSDFFKRIFDIVVSLTVLFLCAPFFALIALAITRETPGPVFYRGARVGRGGKCFKILKFRTMYENPQSYAGPRVTAQDDIRVTPLGHWLRDTKLNEFPQFWNVLKGEMSLVGPRPEDPTLATEWPAEVAREILSVRPGITSPSSVMYRDEESLLCADNLINQYLCDLSPNKIRLDQLYVRHRSFLLDLDTMLWTVLLLLPRLRAYSPPESFLIVGPVTRLIKRHVSWYVLDFLVLLFSIGISVMLLRDVAPIRIDWIALLEMAFAYLALYSLIAVKTGANLTRWDKATNRDAARLTMAWLIATAVVVAIHFAVGITSDLRRILILMSSIFFLTGMLLARYRSRVLIGLLRSIVIRRTKAKATAERVLIVGSGRTAEHVLWLFDHPSYSLKYQVVGIIDDDLFSQGMKVYGVKVVGETNNIAGIVKEKDVGLVILADHRLDESSYRLLREALKDIPVRIAVAPDLYGSMEGLSRAVSGGPSTPALDSFQCRHCLARIRSHVETPADGK